MNARPAWRLGLLIAGLAAFTHCGPPPTLEIRFIGNAAFELTDGRTTLLVDFPYESGTGGFMAYDSGAVRFFAAESRRCLGARALAQRESIELRAGR